MPNPPGPRAGLRLMHVHAHPDDESSKGAASTAMYVAQGVDVHVVTCTGGERGSILNPKMDRPDVLANITEIRRQEMERARDILGVRQDWLGFVDSGWPEGDPKPPLPEGCFATGAARGGGRAAGAAHPRVPAARDDDVRRARRLPAPRPRQVPRGLGGGVRGGRRPGALPGAGRAVAAAQALLPPLVQPAADAGPARGDARPRAGLALGGAAQGVEARARVGRPDHHQGAVRRLLRGPRPGAARARDPDRPRRLLVRDPAGDPARGRAHRGLRAGDARSSTARCPRTTCSPASRLPETMAHERAPVSSWCCSRRRSPTRRPSPRTSRRAGRRSRCSCCSSGPWCSSASA